MVNFLHPEWEELIPFYAADTLPARDARALERHLSRCDHCQRVLRDWRLIAGATRAEAASRLRDLPPLSPDVLRIAYSETLTRRQSYVAPPPTILPRVTMPVTLIAAALTVIIFGGLVALLVFRGFAPQLDNGSSGEVVIAPSITPRATNSPEASQQAIIVLPNVTLPPTNTPVPPTAQQPATVTLPPLPTRQPPTQVQVQPQAVFPTLTPRLDAVEPFMPSGSGGGGGAPDTPIPSLRSMAVGGIPTAQVTSDYVNLRQGPGTAYPVVAVARLGDTYTAEALYTAPDGVWIQVMLPNGTLVWVFGGLVLLDPPDAILPPAAYIPPTPLPTATVIPFMDTQSIPPTPEP